MEELFLFGSLAFWVLVAAEIIALICLSLGEKKKWAVFSFLVFCGLVQWCGNIDIISYVTTHWITFLVSLIGYIVFGSLYMLHRWHDFNIEQFAEIMKYVDANYPAPRDGDKKRAANVYIQHHKPQYFYHKNMLMDWFLFWIFSAPIYFCWDFVARISNLVYNMFSSTFERITNRVFSRLPEDLR